MMHIGMVCEVCGEPVTNIVTDLKQLYSDMPYRQYGVHSHHWFCDRHNRPSMRYGLNGRTNASSRP